MSSLKHFFWEQIKLENRKNEIDEKKNKSNYPTKQPSCLSCVEQIDSRLSFKMIQCILLKKYFINLPVV